MNQPEDNTPPTISKGCPDDVIETAIPGQEVVAPDWEEPNAYDASGQVLTRRSHFPRTNFPVSRPNTTVTYEFYDAAGNIASCSFNVIIESKKTVKS